MKYDFDTVVDRRGTNSLKYDFAKEHGKREDILPLWVADMDFKTAPEIVERLQKAVAHGIYGYSDTKDDYFNAVAGWYRERFGWSVKPQWMVRTPGVVFALATAVLAYTSEGESVMIQRPVYYPFSSVIENNHRKLVNNPLKLVDGHYEIDFEDFENKIMENDVKLFILCSPHNPVSRVWEEWELRKMADICRKHQVIIVSDEIHSDFVFPEHKHTILASLGDEYADSVVICTAPSKTFNLAGLQVSNIFIPNRILKHQFTDALNSVGYGQCNIMGLVACQAAYEEGGSWLEELKGYLYDNYQFIRGFLEERLPQIKLIEPEGTYLLWLDCRELGLSEPELEDLIVNKANLWLDRGAMFGKEGEGFERINIACPRKTLAQALEQLADAVGELG